MAGLSVLYTTCLPGRKEERRVVKAGLSQSPTHTFARALEMFGALLYERSGGRYTVQIFHNSRIGNEKEMQEMLTLGSLELSLSGVLNNCEPLFAVFELPYLYRDREHAWKVNRGPIMEDVSSSLHLRGLHLLGFYENGYRQISNSLRAIETPEDLRGLMIRTPENPAQIETMRALGAVPTPMNFSELYTALVQGVVDGQENPLQNIWAARLYEAQPHIAITGHIYNFTYALVSHRFWETLPPSDRQLFRECMEESMLWQIEAMKTLDEELEQRMKAEGVAFTYPDQEAFLVATRPAYASLYRLLGPKAREIAEKIEAVP